LNYVENFDDANDWFAFRNSLHFSLLTGEFCLMS
jgi:hypothetical protein